MVFGAGLLFLLAPIVQWSGTLVMTDVAVAALSFAAALALVRYLNSGESRDSAVFAILAASNAQAQMAVDLAKVTCKQYLFDSFISANAPKVEPDDMKAIGSKLDFVGLNIYTPQYVRAADTPLRYAVEKYPESYPHIWSPWLTMGPECTYWGVRNVCDLWKIPQIYISENGTSSSDVPKPDGRVDDTDRVMYLRNHLANLHRAVAEGYPVKGYFLWSLMDNFEWADGYSKRFGLHYVDFKTLKRTPKLSAEWYKQVIAENAVL